MRHWRTQSSVTARLPPLFLWKRERKRKEGPFHYHPTCRLMPHGSSQPTVVMAATCHVICVSPCINVDVWDRRPPAGNMHKGHGKCVSPAGRLWDTPTATCAAVCRARDDKKHGPHQGQRRQQQRRRGGQHAHASIQRAFLRLGKYKPLAPQSEHFLVRWINTRIHGNCKSFTGTKPANVWFILHRSLNTTWATHAQGAHQAERSVVK